MLIKNGFLINPSTNIAEVLDIRVENGMISEIGILEAEENEEVMLEEIKNVKTGQVTYAVRDTNIDGKEIHTDDIMGIGDSGILSVGTEIASTTMDMLDQIVDEDSYILINDSVLLPASSQNGMDVAYNIRWLSLKEEKPEQFA